MGQEMRKIEARFPQSRVTAVLQGSKGMFFLRGRRGRRRGERSKVRNSERGRVYVATGLSNRGEYGEDGLRAIILGPAVASLSWVYSRLR